jgi:hypothetical protein
MIEKVGRRYDKLWSRLIETGPRCLAVTLYPRNTATDVPQYVPQSGTKITSDSAAAL